MNTTELHRLTGLHWTISKSEYLCMFEGVRIRHKYKHDTIRRQDYFVFVVEVPSQKKFGRRWIAAYSADREVSVKAYFPTERYISHVNPTEYSATLRRALSGVLW
jgi:hypothetical protein